MWSQPQKQEPIEKIRKAQWTAENTAKTQAAVDELLQMHSWLVFSGDKNSAMCRGLVLAIQRFKQMDQTIDISKLKS